MGLAFLNRQAKKRDRVFAIDLGSHTTKAVHLQRRGGKLCLVDYAVVNAPQGEKALSVEQLSDHLRQVCDAFDGGRPKQATVAIGVGDSLFRQVEVPMMPVSDLRLMLRFNAKTYLQQDLPDHVFDCCYVQSRSSTAAEGTRHAGAAQKHKALVGGARRRTLEDLEAGLRGAGLTAEAVVPGFVGPANAFEIAEPEVFARDVVALVDIGFRHTAITIMSSGEIMLNRVVGLGGERLTLGLSEAMNISYLEAENIKLGMAGEVQTTLESLVNPIGRELRASIDFYENQHDKTVTQVLVCGGTAQSELLRQCLQAELMVPCHQWTPTRAMEMALSPRKMGEVEQMAAQLTVAIGAAAATF